MVLSEEIGLQIEQVKRPAVQVLDSAQERPLVVEDVDGARAEFAAVGSAGDDRAELEIVIAPKNPFTLNRFERKRLHPFPATGFPILRTEIVSGVRSRGQVHVGDALPEDVDSEVFDRHGALEQILAQRQTINQRARVILDIPVRGDGTAVEEIKADETVLARRQVESASQRVSPRKEVIELCERIDRFRLRLLVRKF